MSDLVELARRYVAASDELSNLRDQIRLAVLNGGGEPEVPFTKPVRAPGGSKTKPQSDAQSSHPLALKSAEIDQKVLTLLRSKGSMKTVEIAAATSSKMSTTSERLRRLRARGSVAPAEGGGWTSAPSP
jgi:hypothetical protein